MWNAFLWFCLMQIYYCLELIENAFEIIIFRQNYKMSVHLEFKNVFVSTYFLFLFKACTNLKTITILIPSYKNKFIVVYLSRSIIIWKEYCSLLEFIKQTIFGIWQVKKNL